MSFDSPVLINYPSFHLILLIIQDYAMTFWGRGNRLTTSALFVGKQKRLSDISSAIFIIPAFTSQSSCFSVLIPWSSAIFQDVTLHPPEFLNRTPFCSHWPKLPLWAHDFFGWEESCPGLINMVLWMSYYSTVQPSVSGCPLLVAFKCSHVALGTYMACPL